MQTMSNNKYKTEQRSEHFFHPESVAAGAAKASIAFLSTAAQNAGAIASSALGSTSIYDSAETADYKPLRPLRTMPVIDENKPKEVFFINFSGLYVCWKQKNYKKK